MKTVAVTNRSREMKRLLELAREDDVVVRTPEGEEFVLSVVDDFAVELTRQRHNKKLMAFLDERFRKAREEPGTSLEEVKRRLGPTREKGRRESKGQGRRKKR